MMSLVEREILVRQCQEETRAKGLTVKQWCSEKGVSVKTFYNWKRRAGSVTEQKRQWAVLPAENSEAEDNNVQNNTAANYQITYSGYTVNLTNKIKTDTLTEILKAVKQACC
jgi:predicted site-specific integrase-resolvase